MKRFLCILVVLVSVSQAAAAALTFESRVRLFSGFPSYPISPGELKRIANATDGSGSYYSFRVRPAAGRGDGSAADQWQSIELFQFGPSGRKTLRQFPLCGKSMRGAEISEARLRPSPAA